MKNLKILMIVGIIMFSMGCSVHRNTENADKALVEMGRSFVRVENDTIWGSWKDLGKGVVSVLDENNSFNEIIINKTTGARLEEVKILSNSKHFIFGQNADGSYTVFQAKNFSPIMSSSDSLYEEMGAYDWRVIIEKGKGEYIFTDSLMGPFADIWDGMDEETDLFWVINSDGEKTFYFGSGKRFILTSSYEDINTWGASKIKLLKTNGTSGILTADGDTILPFDKYSSSSSTWADAFTVCRNRSVVCKKDGKVGVYASGKFIWTNWRDLYYSGANIWLGKDDKDEKFHVLNDEFEEMFKGESFTSLYCLEADTLTFLNSEFYYKISKNDDIPKIIRKYYK